MDRIFLKRERVLSRREHNKKIWVSSRERVIHGK